MTALLVTATLASLSTALIILGFDKVRPPQALSHTLLPNPSPSSCSLLS